MHTTNNIHIIQGDLLNATQDIIAHQVNCLGIMGAGLAKQIKDIYPEVYKAYVYFTKIHDDLTQLHGKNLITNTHGKVPDTRKYVPNEKYVSNIYGQVNIGRVEYSNPEQVSRNYQALEKGLLELYDFATRNELSVALPYGIGAGLAGGNWNVIYQIIEQVFHDYPVYLYKLN